MRRALLPLLLVSCSSPPQTKSEAAVVYHAGFRAEPGVMTEVLFPFSGDGLASAIQNGLSVSDGGSVSLVSDQQGPAIKVSGQGVVDATFSADRLAGLTSGTDVPNAILTRGSVDGGYYFRVNKGGSASCDVEFEYTVSRDCGGGCGGKRSWTYSGQVGLALQVVKLSFNEEKTP